MTNHLKLVTQYDNLVLDKVAAKRFGEIRQELGLSQADVSRAALERGMDWSRNSVHAIERFATFDGSGTRRLTLTELFEFPKVMKAACEAKNLPYKKVHPAWFFVKDSN